MVVVFSNNNSLLTVTVIVYVLLSCTSKAIPRYMVVIRDPMQDMLLRQVVVPLGGDRSVLCEANENSSQIYWSSQGELIPTQQDPGMMSGSAMDPLMPPLSSRLQNVIVDEVSNRQTLLWIREATEENMGTFKCTGMSSSGEMAFAQVEVIVEFGKFS